MIDITFCKKMICFWLVLFLSGCATPYLVKDGVSPHVKSEMIIDDVINFHSLEIEGKKYLLSIVKESTFYPEFNNNHILITDLNGNIHDGNFISSDLINKSLSDKYGTFIGNVVASSLFLAATGSAIFFGGDNEIQSSTISKNNKYLALQQSEGLTGSNILLFDTNTGELINVISEKYEILDDGLDDSTRKRIAGHSRNVPLGFVNDTFYSLSSDFSFFGDVKFYLNINKLSDNTALEMLLPENIVRWFTDYRDFAGKIVGLTDDNKTIIYDCEFKNVSHQLNLTEELGDIKCTPPQGLLIATLTSTVSNNTNRITINRNSFGSCRNLTIQSVKLDTGEVTDTYSINTKYMTRVTDYDGNYNRFGILSEYAAPKSFAGVLNYTNNNIVPIYENETIIQDSIITHENRVYYYYLKSREGLHRIDITNYVP